MTDREMAQAIRNLTKRMNRVEANSAHNKTAANDEAVIAAIDNALALLDRVQSTTEQTSKDFAQLAQELRSGR